jgi:hypothetical protein
MTSSSSWAEQALTNTPRCSPRCGSG